VAWGTRRRAITTANATNVSTRPRKIFEKQLTATVSKAARRRNVATNLGRHRGVAAATAIYARSAILIS
jgi:hypothetical protein